MPEPRNQPGRESGEGIPGGGIDAPPHPGTSGKDGVRRPALLRKTSEATPRSVDLISSVGEFQTML